MLGGEPATEQCVVIDGVNFLNNADLDGTTLPPAGAPNIMMATGGTQLREVFDDDGGVRVAVQGGLGKPVTDTKVTGPVKIPVAPYHYLCDGQLTSCVPQPGTDRRLDAQGDKIMARLVYRQPRRPRVDRRGALGEHRGGRRRRALVRVRRRRRPRGDACASRAPTRPTASIAGWRARPSTGSGTSASAIRSAARRTSPASDSPADSRRTARAC